MKERTFKDENIEEETIRRTMFFIRKIQRMRYKTGSIQIDLGHKKGRVEGFDADGIGISTIDLERDDRDIVLWMHSKRKEKTPTEIFHEKLGRWVAKDLKGVVN